MGELFIWAGYFFGNIPLIRDNFGVVTIIIVVVSVLPMVAMIFRREKKGPVQQQGPM